MPGSGPGNTSEQNRLKTNKQKPLSFIGYKMYLWNR